MSNPDSLTVPHTVFQEDVTFDVDVIVQDKLAKAGINEDTIKALAEEVAPLLTEPITDPERAKLVKGMLAKVVNARNIIVRICEHGRKPALMVQKAYIAKEKEYTSLVRKVEDPLEKHLKVWTDEQDRIEREAKEAAENKIRERKHYLQVLEFTFHIGVGEPDYYYLGTTKITNAQVENSDDAVWAHICTGAQMAFKELCDKRQADAEAKEAQELALKQQKEELDRRERELKAREAALTPPVEPAYIQGHDPVVPEPPRVKITTLSDAERWTRWVAPLTPPPVMTSDMGRHAVAKLIENMNELGKYILNNQPQ